MTFWTRIAFFLCCKACSVAESPFATNFWLPFHAKRIFRTWMQGFIFAWTYVTIGTCRAFLLAFTWRVRRGRAALGLFPSFAEVPLRASFGTRVAVSTCAVKSSFACARWVYVPFPLTELPFIARETVRLSRFRLLVTGAAGKRIRRAGVAVMPRRAVQSFG